MKSIMAWFGELSAARLAEIQKLSQTATEEKTEEIAERVVSDMENIINGNS